MPSIEPWRDDYSERFDELRRNRVQVSHYKYGRASKNFRAGNVDALATMDLCIQKYRDTGNTEYLVDAANYCMFEFMFPQVKGAHFRPTDSAESAGVVGITEVEMKKLREEDY